MRKDLRVSIVIIFFLIRCFEVSPGQSRDVPRGHGVKAAFKLRLAIDETTVRSGEVLTMRVLLVCDAVTPWLVYMPMEEGPGASYNIFFRKHSTNEEVSGPIMPDAHVPPGRVRLTRMENGFIVGAYSTTLPADYGLVAGQVYDAQAVYHSPLGDRSTQGLPILSKYDGQLESNIVQVTVRP